MVRMASYLPDFGRLVIRSIETYWKGPCDTGYQRVVVERVSGLSWVLLLDILRIP